MGLSLSVSDLASDKIDIMKLEWWENRGGVPLYTGLTSVSEL